MDSKKLAIIGGITAGIVLVGGLAYFMMSGDQVEEETKDEKETFDDLLDKMKAEIKKRNTSPKLDNGRINGDYLINVFYILSKYTAMVKLVEDQDAVNTRVELLRAGKDAEYEKVRRETEEEDNKKMETIQNIAMTEFDITEQEYQMGYQTNVLNPSFIQKLNDVQGEIVREIQSVNPDEGLPEGLTREKAVEIRDFAKEQTQKKLIELQRSVTNQSELQEKFMFEVAKLDDVILMKYGFKNTDVLKAFTKYNLIPKQNSQMA